MKKALFAIAFLSFTFVTNAATVSVNCNLASHRNGMIGKVLQTLNPQVPNTVNITGKCKENVTIYQFDRLSLVAAPSAVIEDASGGQQDVILIWDSGRVSIQGFTISGGSNGISCGEGSFCTLRGNTIEGGVSAGVVINHSQGDLSDDIVQDTGFGLDIEYSTVYASGLTLRQNSQAGIYSQGMVMNANNLNILDNAGEGINVGMNSNVFLMDSTVSNNAGDGIGVFGHSYAFLMHVTDTNNGVSGVAIGDLSLADFYSSGTFVGNQTDIGCWGQYSAAGTILAVTYGTTNCPVPTAQEAAGKRTAPPPQLKRPIR